MSNEMPSPEKLDEIQKDYVVDEEQIKKDNERGEAFEAGKMKGSQEVQQAPSLGKLRDEIEMMEVELINKIDKMIKKENIMKGDRVEITFKDGSSFVGKYQLLNIGRYRRSEGSRYDKINVEALSDRPPYEMRLIPLEEIETIKKNGPLF